MSFTQSSNLRGEHRVAIAIGSNIGDRQGNVAAAIHKLRSLVWVDRVSSVYETKPVGYTDQPDFLNLACTGWTDLPPRVLRAALAKIERQIGRRVTMPLGPRAIDLDLLLYDDLIMPDDDCTLPHPGLSSRAFVLVPLAEIAPSLVDPLSRKTIAELAAHVDKAGVVLKEGGLLTRIRRDVQESRPVVPLSLNRVGITGVKTLIAVDPALSSQRTTIATFDIYADLDASHSGVHMSRFSQDLEDALAELAGGDSHGVDELAVALARRVVESQHGERAIVHVRAPLALDRITPASALRTREFYTVVASAVATASFSRRLLGVEAEGMTACPCAQNMIADHSRERLLAEGFDEEQIARVLSAVPLATHNQRGLGTFMVGADAAADVRTLVEIVEQSMSAETYDLLKRPDELFVVNKAHQAPRFVEDVVREMLRYAHDALSDLPDEGFVLARQVNFESIHKHDAVAESCSTLGELRRELRGEPGVRHTTLEQWLGGEAGTTGDGAVVELDPRFRIRTT
jgi:GTP cyclohydrolase IV